jgi:hypothetical protein
LKSNLMVFIRPVILEGAVSAGHFTNQKYSLIRARQLEAKIGQRGLIKDSAAELPSIDILFAPVPAELKAKNTRQLQSNEIEPAQQAPVTTAPAQSAPAATAPAQPVTVTGQPTPADQPQSSTAPEPVTVTGQPAETPTEEQPAPPAGSTEERKPDVTGLPDIKLE